MKVRHLYRYILGLSTLGLLALAPVSADVPAPMSGTRTSLPGGGLTANSGGRYSNLQIDWNITQNGGIYTYIYTFTDNRGSARNISHVLLQMSNSFLFSNLLSSNPAVTAADLRTYNPGGPGNSNPGLPGSIYGFKFQPLSPFGGGPVQLSFTTDRAPVYGDLYLKGGQDYLFNTGFGTDPATGLNPYTNWIARPDTQTVVAEPATILLLGSGLAACLLKRGKKA